MGCFRAVLFSTCLGLSGLAESVQADFASGWAALRQQDFAAARGEFEAAARAGDARAALALADLSAQGKGGPVDAMMALQWRQRAAELGDAGAQYALGLYFQQAVPMEATQAERWFRQAAEGGHPNAQLALGRLLQEQGGGREAEGFGWLKRAAGAGLADAQRAVAVAYAEGRGVENDPARAREMNEAADRQAERERHLQEAERARQAAEQRAARLQRENQRLHDYSWGYDPWWGWHHRFQSGLMFEFGRP
jgi:TPR repeat protein